MKKMPAKPPDRPHPVTVRTARPEDLERLADLCGQLGYPSTIDQVRRRMDFLDRLPGHAVFVAVREDGFLMGWIHVFLAHSLVVDRYAEIGGLVVDSTCRREGVGRTLVRHAEQWSRKQGCDVLRLRSNITRQESHPFYQRLGFQTLKTQVSYRKVL